nr:MAG TPA: hypothetical protein [Caudoviricetes sp.]
MTSATSFVDWQTCSAPQKKSPPMTRIFSTRLGSLAHSAGTKSI